MVNGGGPESGGAAGRQASAEMMNVPICSPHVHFPLLLYAHLFMKYIVTFVRFLDSTFPIDLSCDYFLHAPFLHKESNTEASRFLNLPRFRNLKSIKCITLKTSPGSKLTNFN